MATHLGTQSRIQFPRPFAEGKMAFVLSFSAHHSLFLRASPNSASLASPNSASLASYRVPPLRHSVLRPILQWNSTKHGQAPDRSSGLQTTRVYSMTGERWDDGRRRLEAVVDSARNLFERLPQPMKMFPWSKAWTNYLMILLGLAAEVAKYLCIPALAVSSLSEMSYCAHERKMVVIPIPLLAGIVLSGVIKDTIVELSPDLKEGDFPWHLFSMVIFFLMLKLPGPYYPYLGRLIVPHFANGGLWKTLWFTFQWYKRARESTKSRKTPASQIRSDG